MTEDVLQKTQNFVFLKERTICRYGVGFFPTQAGQTSFVVNEGENGLLARVVVN